MRQEIIMAEVKKNVLSIELKVATTIYRVTEIENNVVWLGKLIELVENEASQKTISTAIDTLFDWGIIKAEFGLTSNGRAGRLFLISNESKATIQDLYERFWKNYE
jgi:hypothetical protein